MTNFMDQQSALAAFRDMARQNRFSLRCAARELAAAGRYGEAVAGFDVEMKHFTPLIRIISTR